MIETQQTLNDWADETFGKCTNGIDGLAKMFERADKEWEELRLAVANNKNTLDDKDMIAEEIADIVMMMYRMCGQDLLNVDLHREIDYKMIVNRKRTWKLDGHGHGEHEE